LLDFAAEKGFTARKNQLRKKKRVNYFFIKVVILQVWVAEFAICESFCLQCVANCSKFSQQYQNYAAWSWKSSREWLYDASTWGCNKVNLCVATNK
jgi:hypothetical protein